MEKWLFQVASYRGKQLLYSLKPETCIPGNWKPVTGSLKPGTWNGNLKDLIATIFSHNKLSTMGIADRLFQQRKEKAEANLKAGNDFLEANKQKPGVVALPSGLQYEVITEGAGAKPGATSNVTCHYHGTLIDGTVFDSSVRRGQPATFPLNRVIKGWTEGLQLMPAGSKWRFFIPPHLGYGEQQVSAQIGPNSTLVFEVELLSIS